MSYQNLETKFIEDGPSVKVYVQEPKLKIALIAGSKRSDKAKT